MAKSLPPVSAKLVADAEQFIAEFRRAERAAQGSTGRVGAEVDKMAKTLSKKFSLSDIGKSFLGGLGLGSGFAVVDTVFSKISQAYTEHQEQLKEIDGVWKEILAKSKEYQFSLATPGDQIKSLEKDLEALQQKYLQLVAPKKIQITASSIRLGTGMNKSTPAFTAADELALAENLKAQQAAGIKLAEARKTLAGETKKLGDAEGDLLAKIAAHNAGVWAKNHEDVARALAQDSMEQAQLNTELENAAQKYRELVDPSLRYKVQMEEVNRVLAAGKITVEEADAAFEALIRSMDADEVKRVDEALKDFFDPIDDISKGMNHAESAALQFADSLGNAFDESIIQGKELDDVIGDLGRSIMATFLKLSVINPLMNSIFGGVSGWTALPSFFGGGKAGGGPVSAGTSYMVGEEGPEMFTPKSAGTITPNHALGGSAKTYFIDARGADRTGLARLEAMIQQLNGSIEHRAVGAVMDFRRRGAAA